MSSDRQAIIVDNDERYRKYYMDILTQEGYKVAEFSSGGKALEYLSSSRPNVAIVHFKKDIRRSLRFVEKCAELDPSMSILYSTFFNDPDLPGEAIKLGAFAVVDKRSDRAELGRILDRAYNQSAARRQHQEGGPNVVVLMPSAKRFTERYTLGIKEPLEGLGVSCERVEELGFAGDIMSKIFALIEEATVIVADMTSRNPNVFYEVGYAQGLGKPVVLLTEGKDDFPFDLRNQKHIIYGRSIVRLREELLKTVKELLKGRIAPVSRKDIRESSPPEPASGGR